MTFGRRREERISGGDRRTALVVEADLPLDNPALWGSGSGGNVRILIGEGTDPIYAAKRFKLDEDHWLVPGMEIPVIVEPGNPDEFEIDWAAIPGIEERVASNDPVLADPRGARSRVVKALESAGLAGPDPAKLGGGMGDVLERGKEAKSAATVDRFAEAMERAAREPAPPGRTRAVALISTTTMSRVARNPDGGGGFDYVTSGRRKTVLAVNVPGQAPYAVLVRRFKHPRKRADVAGAGIPAAVSNGDSNDVEVLWDELPSATDQVAQRISDELGAAQAQQGELERGMTDAIQSAIAEGPPPMAPGDAPPGTPQPGSPAQEAMLQSAKRALEFVQDPAMRKMMIEQYRAAGIQVEDDQ